MSKLVGVFIIGILVGWLIEWIFVRLFVPNPQKKVEAALKASHKENDTLQQQNRALQAELTAAKTAQISSPPSQTNVETIVTTKPVVTSAPEAATADTTIPAVETTVTEVATAVAESANNDDLTKLSGIGPKLAEAMQANGIQSYAQLAILSTDDVNAKLASSGIRYSKAIAESWAKQATFAAASDWSGLKTYQQTLKN